jgi:hypothetical protein
LPWERSIGYLGAEQRSRMEQSGIFIGLGLLILVTVCGWALGAKANSGVRQFREEHHENFVRRKEP